MAKLTAADATYGDNFGNSVAIDGNTVVVGAHQEDSRIGAAYVFRTVDGGATYVELAKLTASDRDLNDNFGICVAIDSGTVVVGAYADTHDGGLYAGSAYVFRTSDGGATYGQVTKLMASDAAVLDYFGRSVAIDGDTIVIGADGDDDGGSQSGSVYVFRTDDGGATYGQVDKLTASDASSSDYFGYSVAIDGDTVVVGAPDGYGAVYVFRTTDGGATYAQVAKLTAADAAVNDNFGRSVAIAGGTIVVGANGTTPQAALTYIATRGQSIASCSDAVSDAAANTSADPESHTNADAAADARAQHASNTATDPIAVAATDSRTQRAPNARADA